MPFHLIKDWKSRLSERLATIKLRGGMSYIFQYAWDWFFIQGYIFDWAIVIAWIVIANTVPLKKIKPVERFFNDSDPTLSYPTVNTPDPVVSRGRVAFPMTPLFYVWYGRQVGVMG